MPSPTSIDDCHHCIYGKKSPPPPVPRRCGGGGGGAGGEVRGVWRFTNKAVHTLGRAHKRRSVATALVLLFKGPQARRYTHKAVHTEPVATAGVFLFKCTQKGVCGDRRSFVI